MIYLVKNAKAKVFIVQNFLRSYEPRYVGIDNSTDSQSYKLPCRVVSSV